MRPVRGRSGATKSKPCFVRLEKCSSKDEKSDEEDRKKLTGPIKKRPVIMKKKAGRPSKKLQVKEEDLSEYMLATARSRRTPKPNPKYSNDDIVTPKSKLEENPGDSDYEFEQEDDEIHESTEPEAEISSDIGDSSDEMVVFKERNRTLTKTHMKRSVSPTNIKRGPGRPPKSKIITQYNYDAKSEKISRPNNSSGGHSGDTELRKRKLDYDIPESSILARNKRLNIELYDASDSDVSNNGKIRITSRTSTQKSASTSNDKQNVQKSTRPLTKLNESSLRTKKSNENPSDDDDDDDDDDDTNENQAQNDDDVNVAQSTTVDDFETMPTFTIVNINDIINKKGDVLIKKTKSTTAQQQRSTSETNRGSGGIKKPDKTINDDDGNSPSSSSSQITRNRRKTMHTTILSDKIDHSKLNTPPPRTPFPPRKPVAPSSYINNKNNNNNIRRTQMSPSSSSSATNKNNINNNNQHKSAPRILNSVLAKKNQQPIQSMLTKDTKNKIDLISKENLNSINNNNNTNTSNTRNIGQTNMNNIYQRKLPNEKIQIQRQGNKLIKKITCFETWYVINIPPYEPPIQRSVLEISLTQLGNDVKNVNLPSISWTYKITLQKMNPQQLLKNTEIYTGEVQDSKIDENDKHNYQPINVMFRRLNQNPKLRMPYDRAIIFRNKTFFTNIDGKNVRLLGAPQLISTYSEIEILLKIVDEMTLLSPFVEQSAFIL